MKYKKIILITLLLLAVFAISAVSAVDENNTVEKYDLKTTYDTQMPIEQTNDELANDDGNKYGANISEDDILTTDDEHGDKLGYSYTFRMDSITVNKSSTSFKYPIYISTNGWSQNDVLHITIKDPNGKSSSGMYGFNGNTFYLDITPSIVGKYSVNVKISSYGSSSSNNPTAYITVVDPNVNANTPTNTNTATNTNTNINNANYEQEYYDDYDYYDDYKLSIKIKAPSLKVKYKSNKYFKVTVKDEDDNPIKYGIVQIKVWTGKKVKKFSLRTNSRGIVKFSTKKLKIGAHKVKIKVKGTRDHYGKTVNSKIIVKKKLSSAKKTAYKKKSKYKSVILRVVYSNYYVTKKLKNKDVISTSYEKYSGRQAYPGVHAHVDGGGLVSAKHTKLVKCKVWFKNSYGDVIIKSSNKVLYNGAHIKIGLISGYTPYKAKIWYKTF